MCAAKHDGVDPWEKELDKWDELASSDSEELLLGEEDTLYMKHYIITTLCIQSTA